MGYDCGEAAGALNDQTKSALTRFQREHGLTESGEADTATIQLIEKIHDDPYAYAGDSGGGA